MSTDRTSQRVAVFTRNYPGHLERAARLSASDPDAPIVFRSRVRWASAQEAVAEQDRVEVYIAPMDGGSEVRYTAKLVRVILDPDPNDAAVQQLL